MPYNERRKRILKEEFKKNSLGCKKLKTYFTGKAFEELEESYSQECVVLKAFIDKLKAENKVLQNALAEKNDISPEIGDSYKAVIDDQEKLISKLKASLRQRENQLEKNYLNIEAALKDSECKSDDEKLYLNEESLNFLLQEQDELKQRVLKLQIELASVKNQNEEYRMQLKSLSNMQNPKTVGGRGRIQEIFHLFLGVININSGMCWFRGI
ncbi:unnamed protein product [Larinioides sclopetarius]|uniref:Uncharacterized protein n=1 Tax=Larinioides sclopetarius TaxID=280406 RepID=A0AAV1ZK49_9ARAC